MTTRQKLEIRQSQIRLRLQELAGVEDTLTDEQRSELDGLMTEHRDLESKFQAAVLADTPSVEDEAPEVREWSTLVERFNVGSLYQAVVERRSAPDGVEREVQDELGLAGNMIPVACLEERARTEAPTDVQGNQAPIIPAVFPRSSTAFLRIPQPIVPVGEALYSVLTTSAAPSYPDEGINVTETTGVFSSEKLEPRRIQAAFEYTREDAAVFKGMADALRDDLRAALSNALDFYVMQNSVVGLIGGGLTAPSDPSTESTWETYNQAFASQVDGTYALSLGNLVGVVGSATFVHARSKFRAVDAGDDDAFRYLSQETSGLRVSANVPAKNGDFQDAIIGRALGAAHAVNPIWSGVTILNDDLSKASTGAIVLTGVMLTQFKVLRKAGFSRQRFQLA